MQVLCPISGGWWWHHHWTRLSYHKWHCSNLFFWKGKGQIPFLKVQQPSKEKNKGFSGIRTQTEPVLNTEDSHSTSSYTTATYMCVCFWSSEWFGLYTLVYWQWSCTISCRRWWKNPSLFHELDETIDSMIILSVLFLYISAIEGWAAFILEFCLISIHGCLQKNEPMVTLF